MEWLPRGRREARKGTTAQEAVGLETRDCRGFGVLKRGGERAVGSASHGPLGCLCETPTTGPAHITRLRKTVKCNINSGPLISSIYVNQAQLAAWLAIVSLTRVWLPEEKNLDGWDSFLNKGLATRRKKLGWMGFPATGTKKCLDVFIFGAYFMERTEYVTR
jgi:hypothetical protein